MKFLNRAALVITLCFALAACNDPYGASAKAAADIGTAIGTGFSTVQSLQASGVITSAEALNVAGYLEYANQGDEAFITCIGAAKTAGSKAGTFTACATAFNATLNDPTHLALIHVSDTKASQTISTIVNGVLAGVSAVVVALGGK